MSFLAFSNIFYQIQTKTNKSTVVQGFFFTALYRFIFILFMTKKKNGNLKRKTRLNSLELGSITSFKCTFFPFARFFLVSLLCYYKNGIQKDREETVFKKMGSPPVMVTRVLGVLIGFSLLFLFMIIQ